MNDILISNLKTYFVIYYFVDLPFQKKTMSDKLVYRLKKVVEMTRQFESRFFSFLNHTIYMISFQSHLAIAQTHSLPKRHLIFFIRNMWYVTTFRFLTYPHKDECFLFSELVFPFGEFLDGKTIIARASVHDVSNLMKQNKPKLKNDVYVSR